MRILLIDYDNGSVINCFPHGTAYVAAALREKGYTVEIYDQDVHCWPEEHLTQHLDNNKYDMIGCGIIGGYYQFQKLKKISEAVRASKNQPKYYILAGYGPTPEPDYFLRKMDADVIVLGEGEETACDLADSIINDRPVSSVKGIAYRDGNVTRMSLPRPLIQDIDSIPYPAWDMFKVEYYRRIRVPNCDPSDHVMPVLSARGCNFKCNFCYRMDKGYRIRSSEAIIDEMRTLKEQFGINYFLFNDDLLMCNKKRTIEFGEALIKSKLNIKFWANGRLNYADDQTMPIMKEAGCVHMNYGIESFDDDSLRRMDKALTVKMIEKGIEATLRAGVSPGFNIIWGNIGETKETLMKGVEFLLKYDDCHELRTIKPVTPYPGSPLYYYAIKKGLLRGIADFYEVKHTNSDLVAVNFTDLSDEEFHLALLEANTILLENYYNKQKDKMVAQTHKLYKEQDVTFRGYRQT